MHNFRSQTATEERGRLPTSIQELREGNLPSSPKERRTNYGLSPIFFKQAFGLAFEKILLPQGGHVTEW